MKNEEKLAPVVAKKKLMAIFDLFENSWKIYRDNFKGLVGISLYGLLSLVVLAVGVFVISGLALYLGFKGGDSLALEIVIMLLIIASGLATIFGAAWFSTRAQIGTYLYIKSDFDSVKESWEDSKELFWPFFWLGLLTSLLIFLWLILLVIPGIIFAVFYSFATIIFIFEGHRGMKAIKESKKLVKGYWLQIFGRLAFLGLFFYIIVFFVGLPVEFFNDTFISSLFWNIFSTTIIYIISPFLVVYSVLLYQNIKAIKK